VEYSVSVKNNHLIIKAMKSKVNSINQTGCSVCKKGEENYTTFRPAHQANQLFYQYEYRRRNGDLFSTVAPSLEQCRKECNKWVQAKNYQRLSPFFLKKIQDNNELNMFEMEILIDGVNPYLAIKIGLNIYSREEVVIMFNQIFGTEIN
jgi:hypothetical protein